MKASVILKQSRPSIGAIQSNCLPFVTDIQLVYTFGWFVPSHFSPDHISWITMLHRNKLHLPDIFFFFVSHFLLKYDLLTYDYTQHTIYIY